MHAPLAYMSNTIHYFSERAYSTAALTSAAIRSKANYIKNCILDNSEEAKLNAKSIKQKLSLSYLILSASSIFNVLLFSKQVSLPFFEFGFMLTLCIQYASGKYSDADAESVKALLLQCIKFGCLSLACCNSLYGDPMLIALFLYEHDHKLNTGFLSNMANQYPYVSIVTNAAALLLLLLAAYSSIYIAISHLFLYSLDFQIWGAFLTFILGGAKLIGLSFENLYIPFKQNSPSLKNFCQPKNLLILLAAFFATSSSIFLIPLLTNNPLLTNQSNIVAWLFKEFLFYTVQPMVEELINRTMVLKLLEHENLYDPEKSPFCTQNVLVAMLSAWFFAIGHQQALYGGLEGFLYYTIPGISFALQTMMCGNILTACLFHSLHNLCCSTCMWYGVSFPLPFSHNLLTNTIFSSAIQCAAVYFITESAKADDENDSSLVI